MQVKNIKNHYTSTIPLAIAAGVTLFLFYIDEGYYNFKWMLNIGNWVVFAIYVSILFFAQWLIIKTVTYKNEDKTMRNLKYLLGIVIGLLMTFWLLS